MQAQALPGPAMLATCHLPWSCTGCYSRGRLCLGSVPNAGASQHPPADIGQQDSPESFQRFYFTNCWDLFIQDTLQTHCRNVTGFIGTGATVGWDRAWYFWKSHTHIYIQLLYTGSSKNTLLFIEKIKAQV